MPQDQKMNTPPLVPEGIARGAEGGDAVLIGGHCPVCRRDFFPRPRYCPECLEPCQESILGGQGEIHSYTIVRTRPPFGLPQPYAVGYIDLSGSGLRIFGLFNPVDIPGLAIGRKVRLEIGPMGNTGRGEPCLRPYFSLAAGEGDHE